MKKSVAMCTYNGSKFLKVQLDSIINQTICIDEIIICDDKSTDNTIQIIEEYKAKYPNLIFLYQNGTNLGSNKNFEKAILLTSGDYIFLSDQDDVWRIDKVEKTIELFLQYPEIQGVFSNGNLINENGVVFTEFTLWDLIHFPEKILEKPINIFNVIKSKGNIVTGATVCFKKESKQKITPFPDSKYILHDGWIALVLSYNKTLIYSTENLFSYRIHPNQQIGGCDVKNINHGNYIFGQILTDTKPKAFNETRNHLKIFKRNLKYFEDIKEFWKANNNFDLNEAIVFNQNKIAEFNKILKHNFFLDFTLTIMRRTIRRKKRHFLKKYFNYKKNKNNQL